MTASTICRFNWKKISILGCGFNHGSLLTEINPFAPTTNNANALYLIKPISKHLIPISVAIVKVSKRLSSY